MIECDCNIEYCNSACMGEWERESARVRVCMQCMYAGCVCMSVCMYACMGECGDVYSSMHSH